MAWENLDTARVILEKYLAEQLNISDSERRKYQSQLADVFIRLGDLENWNEQFALALVEYQKCLDILKQFENPKTSRRIAEAHFLIGKTHLYSVKHDKNALQKTLDHYISGRIIISNVLNEATDPKVKEELIDVLKSLDENICDVREELASADENNKGLEYLQKIKENPAEGMAKS